MKKNVVLYIDTSSNEEIVVSLIVDGKEDEIREKIGKNKAQVVLPMIDQLLKKHGLSSDKLTNIQVNTGPGSFTGLRVGVSIANALGFSLQISVNGKKVGEYVEAVYE